MATRKECLRALDENEQALGGLENVVGMGVVQDGDEHVVAVYVLRKLPKAGLAAEQVVPEQLASRKGEVVRVKVIEQGIVDLERGEAHGYPDSSSVP